MITETDLFCLVDGTWEGVGGGWGDDSPLARIDVPPGHANLHGMNRGQVTRRPVEAPTGAFVVCGEHENSFTVRFLNFQETLLVEVQEPAGISF